MNLHEAPPISIPFWVLWTFLTFTVACCAFLVIKSHVIRREGFRAGFRAWDGPGAWFWQTLIAVAVTTAGGMLLLHVSRAQ